MQQDIEQSQRIQGTQVVLKCKYNIIVHAHVIPHLYLKITIWVFNRDLFLEWLKNGGVDEFVHRKRKVATYIKEVLKRVKRNGINTNIGYDARPNQWHGRQPHLPRSNIALQQLRPYSSQDVGYSRPRIHGSKLDDWRMLENGNPGPMDYGGMSIDDVDYPSYGEGRNIYVQKPAQIIPSNTSPPPPPKEIQSAISLLEDYWIEGDEALKKHKTTVLYLVSRNII